MSSGALGRRPEPTCRAGRSLRLNRNRSATRRWRRPRGDGLRLRPSAAAPAPSRATWTPKGPRPSGEPDGDCCAVIRTTCLLRPGPAKFRRTEPGEGVSPFLVPRTFVAQAHLTEIPCYLGARRVVHRV